MTALLDAPPALSILDEMLSLEQADGISRAILNGEIRTYPDEYPHMTTRGWIHGEVENTFGTLLKLWAKTQPKPWPRVGAGEVRVRLNPNVESTVGVDVIVRSPDTPIGDKDTVMGPPLLCVEILSPSDTIEGIIEKLDAYLAAGVPLVWIVEPSHRKIEIYKPRATPRLAVSGDALSGENVLPGFSVAVDELFE